MANTLGGRSTWRNCSTVRSWCRTIPPAPSTASPTASKPHGRVLNGRARPKGGAMIRLAIATGLLLAVTAGHADAADARAGRAKVAGVCQACHGMDGLSKNPEAPNLAGQIEQYLAKSL